MKQSLDTGVEVDNNEVKKNQRHTTNKKPNMYKDIKKDNQYRSVKQTFFRVIQIIENIISYITSLSVSLLHLM